MPEYLATGGVIEEVPIRPKSIEVVMEIETPAARSREFARERDWEPFHRPKNLAMARARHQIPATLGTEETSHA